mgnify:CR=1 FL=1
MTSRCVPKKNERCRPYKNENLGPLKLALRKAKCISLGISERLTDSCACTESDICGWAPKTADYAVRDTTAPTTMSPSPPTASLSPPTTMSPSPPTSSLSPPTAMSPSPPTASLSPPTAMSPSPPNAMSPSPPNAMSPSPPNAIGGPPYDPTPIGQVLIDTSSPPTGADASDDTGDGNPSNNHGLLMILAVVGCIALISGIVLVLHSASQSKQRNSSISKKQTSATLTSATPSIPVGFDTSDILA